jgi:hypothetical protein
MTMEVTNYLNPSFTTELFDKRLRMVNRGVQDLTRHFPAAVEIAANQACSIIASNNAVGVQHRDNLEDKVLS